MANLARIGPGSKVLDPFTGCCSLLLSAAFLQRVKPTNPISLSGPRSQSLRSQPKKGREATAPGSLTPSSLGSHPDTDDAPRTSSRVEGKDDDADTGCLVGVDACMGSDVSLIHSNFIAVGLASALPTLTLRWDFAEKLLQVLAVLLSLTLLTPTVCGNSAPLTNTPKGSRCIQPTRLSLPH